MITNISQLNPVKNYKTFKAAPTANPNNTEKQNSPKTSPKTINIRNENLKKPLRVGTFNIEWLGESSPGLHKPRTEKEYQEIAQVIKDSGVDLIGCQEICGETGIKEVIKYIPDFDFILGPSLNNGKKLAQRLGIIYNKKRITCNIKRADELDKVRLGNPDLRAPIVAQIKADQFDFVFVVCHMKAGIKTDCQIARKKQFEILNTWVSTFLQTSDDKDLIIVGDMNESTDNQSLSPMLTNKNMFFATQKLQNNKEWTLLSYPRVIDHILISKMMVGNGAIGGAMQEFIAESCKVVDHNKYPNFKENVSDHKLVYCDFNASVDND